MTEVKDIMTTDVITISPDAEILEAARILMDSKINGIPVVKDDTVIGILCQSDLIAQQKKFPVPSLFSILDGYITLTSGRRLEKEVQKIAATRVNQAMTPNPVTIHPETTIEEVAALMVDKNFHTLPVVDAGRLVGIVGKEDVLKLMVTGLK
jgi:CBS domain-containing protein